MIDIAAGTGYSDPATKTIVVAMSGGVDSSVVAIMLKKMGYRVIGVTLQLYDQGAAAAKRGACCAGQDIYDAKMVAAKMDIPHYVLDYESKFRESVISDFVDSYTRGETPLPCVRCNQSVKFRDLVKIAKDLNADGLATGHYVRKVIDNGSHQLRKGFDPQKDQSYFLFATTKEQLAYLHFPLGGLTKVQTRQLAQECEIIVANKPDSQDICFVPDGKYADFIAKVRPTALKPGVIMHVDGYELGRHQGVINYTIGQRKGINISFSKPLYVTKIDPENHIVYVGEVDKLGQKTFQFKELNWIGDSLMPPKSISGKVKIRSTHNEVDAIIDFGEKTSTVNLIVAENSVTPGQACVIYDGDRVLGGGWIIR